jgi:thiol-disulfide isomerase/thioredoxin
VLPGDVDKAWAAVEEASQPPRPPASWNQKKPSQEEYADFKLKMGQAAAVAADRAKEFYLRWPDHARAAEAKSQQRKMLVAAVQLGVTDRESELKALPASSEPAAATASAAEKGASDDSPAPTPQDAEYMRRVREAITEAQKLQSQGMEAMVLDYEKRLRALNKEFPDRAQYFAGLLEVAQLVSGDKALQISREIAASTKAPPQAREMAQTMLKSLERQGKPLELKFKAVDGREVDLTKMKGKVVLVDFWATWCGPCRVEIPNVRAAYERLNPKGFEIVGISFDEDKEALVEFTKKNQMPWVQYFDGQGWGNKFGREFGISGVPTMWLMDKKGNLRDLNGRTDLAAKVEKLLAEE